VRPKNTASWNLDISPSNNALDGFGFATQIGHYRFNTKSAAILFFIRSFHEAIHLLRKREMNLKVAF